MRKILDFTSRRAGSHRFERVMRPHFDALYGAAWRIAGSASNVEDLVQEVCLKAYLKLDELELIDHQRAWLLRVLYNVFIDGQRKSQRSPLTLAQGSPEDTGIEVVASDQFRPDKEVDRMMQIDNVLSAMKLLDKEQCALLILHEVDGYDLKELQSLTGLPVGTLKSKLHRTRAKLGRLLRKEKTKRSNLSVAGK